MTLPRGAVDAHTILVGCGDERAICRFHLGLGECDQGRGCECMDQGGCFVCQWLRLFEEAWGAEEERE